MTFRVRVLYCLLDTFIVSTYDLRISPSRTLAANGWSTAYEGPWQR